MPDVHLFDYHAEYLGQLYDRGWRPGFARCFVILDLDLAEEAGIKVDLSELPHVQEAANIYGFGGHVILVTGDLDAHKSLFCEMVQELIEGPQGADDDTFDYWPGAMETLEMYAKELFELSNDYFYYEQLVEVATKNKDVPEWDEESQRIIELYEVRT